MFERKAWLCALCGTRNELDARYGTSLQRAGLEEMQRGIVDVLEECIEVLAPLARLAERLLRLFCKFHVSNQLLCRSSRIFFSRADSVQKDCTSRSCCCGLRISTSPDVIHGVYHNDASSLLIAAISLSYYHQTIWKHEHNSCLHHFQTLLYDPIAALRLQRVSL